MKQEIIFISDLHISLEKPEITKRFLSFLEQRAPKARALYILGDLFDAWIGDDDFTPPSHKIRNQLKKLTDSGTDVFFQPGNRDFLLGQRFCSETGITLLGDYAVIELNTVRTLLTHGDLLCTDDIPYQEFRAKSRRKEWQQNVLAKPLFLRLLAARWYRIRSFLHKRKKTQEIMDVNQNTVEQVMLHYRAPRLIHGHTHKPAIHDFVLNQTPATRFVLADWKTDQAQILCWDEHGYQTETLG